MTMVDYLFWAFVGLTILGICYIIGLFEGRRSQLSMRLARLRARGQAVLDGTTSNSSFLGDYRAGLSSQNFDISINIDDGDARPGLDSEEVRRIMEEHGVSFDKARLMRQQRVMGRNNIDPETGMPMDPKAVTFSR
ncbi:hypothetical protein IW140_000091 [Coemansia sp. RSA 1813]|nr:hypothetical protein EV178_000106 [Coemansia sp. RSA 1646]KAJ1771478.1 hypothetical protein LPJ74_002298 [Coemansia sp. RSA 1843]KAJ2093195.1 hypothetical protein IW138_000488 [Coemansia sp. RSA 986]KAJ2217540.1 hypothetical protein EV179_000374 [Coemansia sp. RSA 487]KAJ2573449.1 hypothetical protein IW140_000091 [Coemansia sp. RSA 1813]